MNQDLPTRAERRPTFCSCVLVFTENGIRKMDSCSAATSGPDEPLCDSCLESGHPDHPGFSPVLKKGQ